MIVYFQYINSKSHILMEYMWDPVVIFVMYII